MDTTDIIISPSLLSVIESYPDPEEHLKDAIDMTSQADWYHIDIADNIFAKGPDTLKDHFDLIRKLTTKPLDVHLMAEHPRRWLDVFRDADAITFHLESKECPYKTIEHIQSTGKKAGIALLPQTPVTEILPYIDKTDIVLLLAVTPGKCGQKFDENILRKIKEIDNMTKDITIEVDGGINKEIAGMIIKTSDGKHKNRLAMVSGSAIFNAKQPDDVIRDLKSAGLP